MITTLNIAEQKLATYIAKSRYAYNRNSGTTDRKIGPQSVEETDLNGIAAEIAFCKMFNIYPDMNTNNRPDHDCITHNGLRIDVKSTKYDSGRLLAVPWKCNKNIDAYVLMVGEFPSYRFAGFCLAEELIDEKNITDLGYGDVYALEQSELRLTMDEVIV